MLIPHANILSASKKKVAAKADIINTIIVVTIVSLRVGQTTRLVSACTSLANLIGLVLAILITNNKKPTKKQSRQCVIIFVAYATLLYVNQA